MQFGLQHSPYSYPRCPGCGLHEAELRGSTHVGCPLCYETFPELIGTIVWEHQRSAVHHGRVPYSPEVRFHIRREAYLNALEKARLDNQQEEVKFLTDLLRLLDSHYG